MTYVQNQPTAPKGRKFKTIALLVIGFIALLVVVVSAVTLIAGARESKVSPHGGAIAPARSVVAPEETGRNDAAAEPQALLASDIRLAVKTTKKDCYGSIGCSVDYSIRLTLTSNFSGECDITYEVHGIEGTPVGTLELQSDGQYSQDGYQSGDTAKSSTKLTAKVTDVDCS